MGARSTKKYISPTLDNLEKLAYRALKHNERRSMNTSLLRKARALWSNPEAPKELNRHNQRAWARSVSRLGDRWLLARHIARSSTHV